MNEWIALTGLGEWRVDDFIIYIIYISISSLSLSLSRVHAIVISFDGQTEGAESSQMKSS